MNNISVMIPEITMPVGVPEFLKNVK